MQQFVCAVDVGTGSARAGIFDLSGELLGRAEVPILTRQVRPGEGEHDSRQIWESVCEAVRAARSQAGVAAEAVRGIAFDATCSLVVRGGDGAQLPVSPDGEAHWDTIAWFDHRALREADECSGFEHEVLANAGGRMSPEMQLPKLMWLKRHLPGTWRAAGAISDLADFLACSASGSDVRSQSTLACKWGYLPHRADPCPREFLEAVGLEDLTERAGISSGVARLGTGVGRLTQRAATALGLSAECWVGAGVVDAYAGALGVLGGLSAGELTGHAALIGGTSSCIMFASETPKPLPSVWGPYLDSALPGLWMSEAGQSATGALLDHVIRLHGKEPSAEMHARIAARVRELRCIEGPDFASRLHVVPDFHGRRAPDSDPHALGVISGLSLDVSFDSLWRLYWRSCVGIALGARKIIETLRQSGRAITTLHVAGGHLRSQLLMELYSDVLDCIIVEPQSPDPMLLGTAMIAAASAGLHPDLAAAARRMSSNGVVRPGTGASYELDYRIFLELQRQRREIEAMMRSDDASVRNLS
ncbi:FGGY-family carbohydrate kinase [Pseudaminobacter sp. 19-2017]|uniref:FGGY-family carbohydrate kinase n=1 Tax=Pseudaminobacter soli (ex Zhang et al. 2022) TaxID=2831468 RepID=A0A942E494_9HYPH|nr:FGGY-family carbohydrate kinase [Pseudaminobacter soli]MBS3650295.1 FGGY-family carbohydrate kinase [Pseudaminobacter soli]